MEKFRLVTDKSGETGGVSRLNAERFKTKPTVDFNHILFFQLARLFFSVTPSFSNNALRSW
jgi:hypothetical protein